MNRSHHDVVVVGARVAGSATAMPLARLGHDVVVLDQASFPEVLGSGAAAIRQVTFNAAGESTSRTIKDKAGVDFLIAPRRYVLDTLLAIAAQRAGGEVRPGVTVTGVQRDGHGRVVGVFGQERAGAAVEFGARFVVGADGSGRSSGGGRRRVTSTPPLSSSAMAPQASRRWRRRVARRTAPRGVARPPGRRAPPPAVVRPLPGPAQAQPGTGGGQPRPWTTMSESPVPPSSSRLTSESSPR